MAVAPCFSLRPTSSSLRPIRVSLASPLPSSTRTVSWPRASTLNRSLRASPSSDISAVLDEEDEEHEDGLNGFGYRYGFYDENDDDDDVVSNREWKSSSRPCELYVCNLPRSCDIAELAEMFKPFGTVFSVEICRNPETGISRGSGFVTLDSVESAKAAIAALDTSDVGGREMRVRFSIQMNPRRRTNSIATNSMPVKSLVYESPYKVYIGNLAWTVQPEDLRHQFGRFGNVTSVRVLHDRKAGKSRAYGFISFSSAEERDAAKSMDGEEFCGRTLLVRDGTERE